MTKNEWESIYSTLDKIYSDFELAYPDTNGGNKKTREAASRKVRNAIDSADFYITKHPEVYKLVIGSAKGVEIAFIYNDDFLKPQYFGGCLSNLLADIRKKIDSFNE